MEGLEGLESFGEFWRVCGLANGSFESLRKPLLWPGPGVPVGEVALALGCMLGKVFGILEVCGSEVPAGVPCCMLEGVWNFGSLDPLQLANGSFEAHRKSLLWPGPEVPAGERCLEFWKFGSFAGWQTAALRPMESHCCGPGPPNCSFEAHRKSLLWPWPPVKAALKASRKSLLWI